MKPRSSPTSTTWLAFAITAVAALAIDRLAVGGQAPPAQSGTEPGTAKLQPTPWGDPDLQGIWGAGYILTPLERPARFAGREFLTDQEVAELEREQTTSPGRNRRAAPGSVADVEGAYNDVFTGRGTRVVRTKRTSLIVDPPDGKIPARTPEGEKRAAALRRVVDDENGPGGRADNPEERGQDRCTGLTIPVNFGSAAVSGAFLRIVQSPGALTIYHEEGHHGGAYRMIPLDGRPHLPPQVRQWLGDARGHWDNGALVVDTTNFTSQTNYQGSRETLHLVERFTRSAPDMILYRVTIDDPTTFTKPWTIEVPYTKADEKANKIFESACHEGNYALTGILAGARRLEKEKAVGKSSSR
ncbi:MAG: hypothetical protein DMF89_24500 [Acidobacteria bacterium]|nr:MAG: hypothetical protein DMF90_15660 [Acidobacteriota bacterium]PYR45620.1 MAG: hypothetical protein DMF89_24500 [Acidobacteriota bacterium]